MGAGHQHGATATGRNSRRLLVVLGVTLGVMVLEIVGAWLSGSLALLADAGHMLTDAAGVTIAVVAARLAARPADKERTFGLQRAEILAALINALILFGIAVFIIIEAIGRFGRPGDVQTGPMLLFGAIGLVANAVSVTILSRGRKESLNVRGAYLEVLGDLLGSVAVLVAAVVIAWTGFAAADSIASLLIAAMILPRAWSLLRDVVDVLLESTPQGVDLIQVRAHMLSVPGVIDMHDVHAWTITSGVPVLSAHVVVDGGWLDSAGMDRVLDQLSECLQGHFDVEHCTFQLEPRVHAVHEAPAHH